MTAYFTQGHFIALRRSEDCSELAMTIVLNSSSACISFNNPYARDLNNGHGFLFKKFCPSIWKFLATPLILTYIT